MKKLLSYSIVACLAIFTLFASCKKDTLAPDGDGPKANTIFGTIYDANGNKFHVPGTAVIVHALGEIGSISDEDAAYNIPMDDKSHFEAQVKSGLYKIHARAFMQ